MKEIKGKFIPLQPYELPKAQRGPHRPQPSTDPRKDVPRRCPRQAQQEMCPYTARFASSGLIKKVVTVSVPFMYSLLFLS